MVLFVFIKRQNYENGTSQPTESRWQIVTISLRKGLIALLCQKKMKNIGIGTRVHHPDFGEGIVVKIRVSTLTVFFRQFGDKELAHDFEGLEIIEKVEDEEGRISIVDMEKALKNVLEQKGMDQEIVPLANKWKNGRLKLIPGDASQQGKEMPVETFFHKILMLRDKLRVLEKQINSQKALSEEEKVHIQQHITRAYGSLTSFNVLFKLKEQQFKGSGK